MEAATIIKREHRKVSDWTADEEYRIFIVEDSSATRTLLENYLYRLPRCREENKPKFKIYTFESGEECLRNLHLRPDIIVLDYYLDESNSQAMDGLVLLRKIRKQLPSAHVIMMSGQQQVMIVAELFNNGIREYVSKEHACHVRVEQAVLRIIEEKRQAGKRRNRALMAAIICLIAGLLIGGLLF